MLVSAKQKLHSLVIVAVAAAFQWFFMFTKHDTTLRPIIPFGDDPYDALGSFATIVNILLCLLVLWRTFRPFRGTSPSTARSHYLRTTQAAIPLIVLVTLAADAVAMVRHLDMWLRVPGRDKLLVVFVAMLAVSSGTLWLVQSSAPKPGALQQRGAGRSAAIIGAIFLFTLVLYPEQLINRLSTHLLTVLIGALLLFAPVAVFLRCLFGDADEPGAARPVSRRFALCVWIGAMLVGLAIGAWLFVSEMTEGGAAMPPIRIRLFVASIYIGLTVIGVLLALAFLRRPLGLARQKRAAGDR